MIKNKHNTLVINEIFYSIQGESSKTGMPCVFIRLTYCNIRCSYCDSEYAFYEGNEMLFDEILDRIKSYNCNLIEITGGEPLFQENCIEFMNLLLNINYEVMLETSGSLSVEKVDKRIKKIIDFKCPSSKMEKKNFWENVNYISNNDEIKFVIGNKSDYNWAKTKILEFDLLNKSSILMSVIFGKLQLVELAEWILKDKLKIRLQIQLHKYIWEPETRGV